LLKLNELFDPEFAIADLLYSLFENAKNLHQLNWLADLGDSQAHVRFPKTGDVTSVTYVEPKELVFNGQVHEPRIIPFGGFGEALQFPLSQVVVAVLGWQWCFGFWHA
jgi:hypothetical protein